MVTIDNALCDRCGTCSGVCPAAAIFISGHMVEVNRDTCTGCLTCISVCPVDAISESGE